MSDDFDIGDLDDGCDDVILCDRLDKYVPADTGCEPGCRYHRWDSCLKRYVCLHFCEVGQHEVKKDHTVQWALTKRWLRNLGRRAGRFSGFRLGRGRGKGGSGGRSRHPKPRFINPTPSTWPPPPDTIRHERAIRWPEVEPPKADTQPAPDDIPYTTQHDPLRGQLDAVERAIQRTFEPPDYTQQQLGEVEAAIERDRLTQAELGIEQNRPEHLIGPPQPPVPGDPFFGDGITTSLPDTMTDLEGESQWPGQ